MFAFSGLKKWEELQQHEKKRVTCTVAGYDGNQVTPLWNLNEDALYDSLWIISPLRSLGSNQVVFGGMMLPVSAMSISCFMLTG